MSDAVPFSRDLLDATSEGLVRVDREGLITYANRAARGILGLADVPDVAGVSLEKILPGAMTTDAGPVMAPGRAERPARPVRVRRSPPGPDGGAVVTLVEIDRAPDLATLARLFDAAPVGAALLQGPDHVFEYANSAFHRLFAPREFMLRPLREAFPEALAHGREALYEDVYRYGNPRFAHERVLQLERLGGRPRGYILNISYHPVRDDTGRVVGILLMMNDVTEEVLARDLLGCAGQNLRQVLDASPAVIWITDERGRCTYISRKWFEVTGRTPVGNIECWYEDIHPGDIDQARAEFDRAISAREVLRLEYRVRGRDGTEQRVINLGFPRHDRAGRFLGHIGTLVDANDRTRFLTRREYGCGR